jgi:hypothetical protein
VDKPLFDPKDFRGIQIKVEVFNRTSGTQINSWGTESPEAPVVTPVEFMERGMKLSMPIKSCSLGHHLVMKIESTRENKSAAMAVTGLVKNIQNFDETFILVEVEWLQFEIKDWESILAIFRDRQEEIMQYLIQVRGY